MGSPTLQTLQDPILLIANALGLLLRRGWSFNAFKPPKGLCNRRVGPRCAPAASRYLPHSYFFRRT
jgi:hypothetical protein